MKEGEDISSLSISLEAMTANLLIDAYEERDIATSDVPGVYLHTLVSDKKNIIMVLCNEFLDML